MYVSIDKPVVPPSFMFVNEGLHSIQMDIPSKRFNQVFGPLAKGAASEPLITVQDPLRVDGRNL